MRTKYSKINALATMVSQVIMIFFSFFNRTVLIKFMGSEYTGINGLFSNVLNVLSLAELGIGSAIVFSMYKPMAENDEKKLKELINFYKTAYWTIGIGISVVGVLLVPFLHFFIKGGTSIAGIERYYLLYLANTVITYFFAYKTALLNVAQKGYIEIACRNIFVVIQNILQIVVIYKFRNFGIYLLLQVLCNAMAYICASHIAVKQYPLLKNLKGYRLEKSEKSVLYKNVKALFFHKIGGVFVNSTDSILVSSLIGLIETGMYSNYSLIVTNVKNLFGGIFSSITASVGNMNAIEDKHSVYQMYEKIFFINFWVGCFTSSALFVLTNIFISVIWGQEYCFDTVFVAVQVIQYYMWFMRQSTLTFRNALGLFWYDRYRALIEAILNLILSIILVKIFGIVGIFLGTIASGLLTYFWQEAYILYRYGFHERYYKYWILYFKYLVCSVLIVIVTSYICEIFAGAASFVNLILRAVIVCIVPNILIFLAFFRTKEMKFVFSVIQKK